MTADVNCILLKSDIASENYLSRHPKSAIIPDSCWDNSKKPGTLDVDIEQLSIDFLNKTRDMLDQFLECPKKFLRKLQFINKSRAKRKERLKTIASVCKFLMRYLELWTLKIGTFTNSGTFVSLCGIKYIAEQTGLAYISVRRALKDLVLSGYLLVEKQVIKKDDGSYVGIASVKQFSTAFFTDLKQRYDKLVKIRDWKRKRLDKRLMKALKKKGASFIKGLVKPFARKKNRQSIENVAADALVAKRKAHAAEVLRLLQARPDFTLDEIKARLAYLLE